MFWTIFIVICCAEALVAVICVCVGLSSLD